jgi:hypothetical protein
VPHLTALDEKHWLGFTWNGYLSALLVDSERVRNPRVLVVRFWRIKLLSVESGFESW